MIVKPGSLAMDLVKVAGIANWPIPSTVRDIQSFLGFANIYHCFIPHFSDTAHPLLDLTKKTHPWSWDQSCNDAFMELKAMFTSQPILHLPDLFAPFAISTDTSKHASGGVLLQKDTNGKWHPCAYLSQTFGPVEHNHDIYDQELLAVMRALDTWHHYLLSSPTTIQVFTDHKNLTYSTSANLVISIGDRQGGYLTSPNLTLPLNTSLGKTYSMCPRCLIPLPGSHTCL